MHTKSGITVSVCAALVIFCAVAGPAHALTVLHGPTPYTSFADSPFNGVSFGYFFIDDLEDGALNTLGVSVTGAVVALPSSSTDSVDADDGSIDGNGNAGHSLVSRDNTISFVFDAVALGSLPTSAGIVWTDVGANTLTFGTGNVIFQAFDSNDAIIDGIGPLVLGDGSNAGATAEDRFFGITYDGGIARIEITMPDSVDWEVDHLQYGGANARVVIPEPTTLLLMGLAAPFALRSRLRRRQ